MNDIELALHVCPKIGELYQKGKQLSIDSPMLALTYLRGIASVYCSALDNALPKDAPLSARIKLLAAQGLITRSQRAALHIIQRNGNKAAHPEDYAFENHDFDVLARESLHAILELIEHLFTLKDRTGRVPVYEIVELHQDGLKDLCYRAMFHPDAESLYVIGMHFKERADQVAAKECILREDGYGISSQPLIARALFFLEQAADQGHPSSMYTLGMYRHRPTAAAEERASGRNLILRASHHENSDALVQVATWYLTGTHQCEKDLDQALELFRLAVSHQHPAAFAALGAIYAEGQGVEVDLTLSAHHTQLAAEAGFPQGQYNLSVLMLEGRGVPQDKATALFWLRAAADQRYPQAIFALARQAVEGLVQGMSLSEAKGLFEMCADFKEFRAPAAMALAQLSMRDSPDFKAYLNAANYLQACYESLKSVGDPHQLEAACVATSKHVASHIRRTISTSPISERLSQEALFTAALFDDGGRPVINRAARVAKFAQLLAVVPRSTNQHDTERAQVAIMRFCGIEVPRHRAIATNSTPPPRIPSRITKQGRNELCRCDSGKKAKRCCDGPRAESSRAPEH